MSDVEAAENKIAGWLQALPDEAAPCGPDLEYDNDFLALQQAAAGKPESQFGAAEPPEWRDVHERAAGLLDRTRDLRVAILWLRAGVHILGVEGLAPGLKLINGLIESHWEHLHPLPDPDDGDPYARVNALTLLRESEGLIGDLREARVVEDRAIGKLSGRQLEIALGLSTARAGETEMSKDQVAQMLGAAVAKAPQLRESCRLTLAQVKQLISLSNEKLGIGVGPDLRPLYALVNGLVGLLPAEAADQEVAAAEGDAIAEGAAASGTGPRRGLSGAVNSRDEAIRAIDLVCEYLERAEPTNPAPLFLRRARQLISHDFLQLLKVLAPDALHEVARVVGVDPDTVEPPAGT
jgi:type VI secretion system protein ImpA